MTLNDPANLRLMGEVTKHEYECFALFVELGVALDRAGIAVFRDTTFLAAGPASERSR